MTTFRLVRRAAIAGSGLILMAGAACGGSTKSRMEGDRSSSMSSVETSQTAASTGAASGKTSSSVTASSTSSSTCATLSCPVGSSAYGKCEITTGPDGCPACTCVPLDGSIPDVVVVDAPIADDAPIATWPEAGTCQPAPTSSGTCNDPSKPHLYRCVLETMPPSPSCSVSGVGNVVDTYCCP